MNDPKMVITGVLVGDEGKNPVLGELSIPELLQIVSNPMSSNDPQTFIVNNGEEVVTVTPPRAKSAPPPAKPVKAPPPSSPSYPMEPRALEKEFEKNLE